MTVRYDIKQVTRYILTRSIFTDKGDEVLDMAEFKRRDDAERVMGTMRAAIHTPESKAAKAFFDAAIAAQSRKDGAQ